MEHPMSVHKQFTDPRDQREFKRHAKQIKVEQANPYQTWHANSHPATARGRVAKRWEKQRENARSEKLAANLQRIEDKAGDLKPKWNEHDAELDLLDRAERPKRRRNRPPYSPKVTTSLSDL